MAGRAMKELVGKIDVAASASLRERSDSIHHVEAAGNHLDQLKTRIRKTIRRPKRKQ